MSKRKKYYQQFILLFIFITLINCQAFSSKTTNKPLENQKFPLNNNLKFKLNKEKNYSNNSKISFNQQEIFRGGVGEEEKNEKNERMDGGVGEGRGGGGGLIVGGGLNERDGWGGGEFINYEKEFREMERKYNDLKTSMKELRDKMNELYLENLQQSSQLKIKSIIIYLLIGIIGILVLILIIIAIFEVYKCLNKKNEHKNDPKFSLNDYDKARLSFLSSGYSGLTTHSNTFKKNEKENENIIDNFNYSNKENGNNGINVINDNVENFNIIHKNDMDKSMISSKSGYDAPIIGNIGDIGEIKISENKKEDADDMKTLTNNEDIYFESKNDKLLYRPYPPNEI